MKYVAYTCALLALMTSSCGSRFNIGEGDDGLDGGPMSGGSAGTGDASTGGSAGSGGSTGGSTGSGGSSGGGGGYEPCENKPCGAECSRCDPADPTCADLAVLMYCDDSGNCGQAFPVCATSQCTTSADCPQVGAPCELCPDNTYACPSVECVAGECVGSFPACQGSTCTSDLDCPQSAAPCQACPDGSTACPWSRCEMGTCVSGYDTCGTTDPCQGKQCGDSCHPCDGIPGCLGPPITMYCDENLTCQTGAPPACGTTNRCMSDLDCPAVELCSPCPDGMACAEMRCIAGVCSLTCDTGGMCSAQGDSCANGETCCSGLQCCAGVPVPPGEEYCGATCLNSDRNLKRDIEPIDPEQILERVAQLPVSSWSYKSEAGQVRHMGPMAQDFQATFGLGASDRGILQVDGDGVALAAIQGLYTRLERLDAENEELRRRVESLQRELESRGKASVSGR